MRSTAERRASPSTRAFITAFGGVRVPLGIPNLSLYGTVGARNFYSGTKLTVSGPFGLFNGTETVNKDWIMPVAGFAAQYRYDDRWFMNMLADLGGWSDSATGQALASVGYNWTQNIATTRRLSRHVHLHPPGHRHQRHHLRAEELPLPAVDVRAVCRVQIQLLIAKSSSPLTTPRNARVTRFIERGPPWPRW